MAEMSTNEKIVSGSYLVRTPFKHNSQKFKTFDEIVSGASKHDPENGKYAIEILGWKAKDIIQLVRSGRIMPFGDELSAEVFHEIPYLMKRSPLGIAAAEMRDVISTGHIDAAIDGQNYHEIPAMVALFSTYCINQFGEKVPTTSMKVIPEDRFEIASNGVSDTQESSPSAETPKPLIVEEDETDPNF